MVNETADLGEREKPTKKNKNKVEKSQHLINQNPYRLAKEERNKVKRVQQTINVPKHTKQQAAIRK